MKLTVTNPNLSIEEICWRYLKAQMDDADRAAALCASGYVESVLDANFGLAAMAAVNGGSVPVGTIITMANVPDQTVITTVNLWE